MEEQHSATDYIAKHDLERLFKDLQTVLADERPDKPIACAISALEYLLWRREGGASVSNYQVRETICPRSFKQEIFKTVLRTKPHSKPSRPFHTDGAACLMDEDFATFSWSIDGDDDVSAKEDALREATSDEGWPDLVKDKAAAAISAGPATNMEGFNRGRRYSISAEPYNPSESKQFHRVVIAKTETTRARIKKGVRGNLLFRNLDTEPLGQIIDAMFEKKVPKGVELIRQGDEGDFFYVVDSGQFVVLKDGEEMVRYRPGDTFGELALMYGSPRMATVKAVEDSIVWAVDRATFRGIVIDLAYRKRRMYESFLRSVPLLHTLHDSELFRICDALQPIHYEPGQIIVRQGEMGHQFFIIEDGEAMVTMHSDGSSEDVEVTRLKKGNYFGELAFLKDAPRAATVRAIDHVKCVTLTKADFIRLLGPVMPILQRNQEHYRKYEEYLTVHQ